MHRIAAARDDHEPSATATDADAHPTTVPSVDRPRRGSSQLWRLLNLLVDPVTPSVLHDIVRQVVTVAGADEVALFAGAAEPVLIAAHGRRAFAERSGLVDRRLERASAMGELVTLGGDGERWRTDPRTVVQHGLWVPSRAVTAAQVVLRVLRVPDQPFDTGAVDLLRLVVKRLASIVAQRYEQQSTNLQHAERAQLFLVSASVAQELDPGTVARRVVEGLTAVTDFASATVDIVSGDEVRRVASVGDHANGPGTAAPLDSWLTALTDDRALGELSYRVPADRALPAQITVRTPVTPGVVTRLVDQHGRLVGFLTLTDPRTGTDLSPEMVQTIELFARQAQMALANAELYDRATHQRDVARTLARLTSALSTSLDTAQVVETCCAAALSLSAGDRASIFLVDDHDVVRHGATIPESDGPDWAPRPLAECPLLAHASETEEPVLYERLASSSYAGAPTVEALGLQSAAVYPLRTTGPTLGLLVIDAYAAPVAFDHDEVSQLTQIASQGAVALRQSALHERTRDQADRAARLLELTTAMTTTLNFAAIFGRIVEALTARLDAHAVSVLRVNETSMDVLGTMVDGSVHCPRPPLRLEIDDDHAASLALVWERETLRVDDVRDCPAWSGIATASTRAVVLAAPPERAETDVLLTVSSTTSAAFSAADEQFIGDVVRVAQLAVRNAELFDRVSDTARRDPLTALFNRRAFWTQLQDRLAHLDASTTVALAVIDADDFKAINDRFGHAVGDASLQHIAERLRSTVGGHGDVFRIGGEEFTVVMPDATADQARRVMQQVARRIRAGRHDLPALSVSAGIAVAPGDGTTADALFGEADRALLDAKRHGKDRVELSRAVA